MQEIIALDYGGRRIGVARANSFAKLPEPLDVYEVVDPNVLEELAEMIMLLKPDLVLVGLPKNLNGQESDQSKLCRTFAINLAKHIFIPIKLVDESLSTVESSDWKQRFPEAGEDSLAACVILSRYLSEGAVT